MQGHEFIGFDAIAESTHVGKYAGETRLTYAVRTLLKNFVATSHIEEDTKYSFLLSLFRDAVENQKLPNFVLLDRHRLDGVSTHNSSFRLNLLLG
jgi:hypothetical protein